MAKGIKEAKVAPAAPMWSTPSGYVTVDQGQASGLGGTGGQPKIGAGNGVSTIDLQYKNAAGTAIAHGYVVAQKGASKYLVADSTNVNGPTTVVMLVNSAAAGLSAGQASVACVSPAGASFYARRITTKHVYDFADHKYQYATTAIAGFATVAVR
jgi:hypothetical protein